MQLNRQIEKPAPVDKAGHGQGSMLHESGNIQCPPSVCVLPVIYRVHDWNKVYENNRSRTVEELRWVLIPNKHDGEGYCLVMAHERAAEIFTAWILILEIASRCNPRGTLIRADGQPITPQILAMRTRGKIEWFELALPLLASSEIGWLETVKSSSVIPSRQSTDSQVTNELNGKKEGNGIPHALSTADRISHERELTAIDKELIKHGELRDYEKGSRTHKRIQQLTTRRAELRLKLGVIA